MRFMTNKKHQFKAGVFIFLIVIVFVLAAAGFAWGESIRFNRISLDEGLSQNTVFCMLQDSKGFMWFGTQDGLNKYDGYTFTVFKQQPDDPNSLSQNTISAVCEDDRGMLWVGTEDSGLNRYDPAEEKFYRYPVDPGNPGCINDGHIKAIFQDKEGAIWIGTEGGGLSKLTRQYDPQKPGTVDEKIVTYRALPGDTTSLSCDKVTAIAADRSGILWIGTSKGLNKFDRKTGKFTHYFYKVADPGSISCNEVKTFFEDSSGFLWVGTARGLNFLDRTTGKFTRYLNRPGDADSLSSNIVTSIAEDHSGVLWIGTINGGLNRFDKKTAIFTRYSHKANNPQSLSINDIFCLYEDRSCNLWIGTAGRGLNKIDRQNNFKYYHTQNGNPYGLSDDFVFSILEDRSGILWIATADGGLNKFDRNTGKVTQYHHDPADINSLGHEWLRCLCQDKAGYLWIGTSNSGLDKFNPGTGDFTHYRCIPGDSNSLSHDIIHAIFEDSRGRLWVGTFGGGLCRFNRENDTFTHFNNNSETPYSLNNNLIDVIYEAPGEPDILLIGTRGAGIFRFDTRSGVFTPWLMNSADPYSLSSNKINCIYVDSSAVLWAGTHGGGLNKAIYRRADKVKFIHYTEKNGLSNNVIYGILEDESGFLWLSTNKGISKFDPKKEIFKNYNARDGLQANEYNLGAYFKSRSGEMFFGGINGFNAFYPSAVKDNPHIPPIVITGFRIANKPVAVGGDSPLRQSITGCKKIELRYNQNVISFEFAALDFTIPGKNRYAYKMEGIDKDWIYLDEGQRTAAYTHLPAGKYLFRVKGSNNDGLWNEQGTAIAVVILPPFYLTWWFKMLAILALAALIYVLCRMKIKAVSARLKQEISFRDLLFKYDISKREKEIIDLILAGKNNKVIEDELYISYHTVKNHLYNIYKKFNVTNRGELILLIKSSSNEFPAGPADPGAISHVEPGPVEIYNRAGKRTPAPPVIARRSFPGMQRKELN